LVDTEAALGSIWALAVTTPVASQPLWCHGPAGTARLETFDYVGVTAEKHLPALAPVGADAIRVGIADLGPTYGLDLLGAAIRAVAVLSWAGGKVGENWAALLVGADIREAFARDVRAV
jgi:hypothetical protein